MTQEEKQLLLKDLCARLPYGVKVTYNISGNHFGTISKICDYETNYGTFKVEHGYNVGAYSIKPYLRPLSSMTEEEEKEYENCFQSDDTTAATLLVDFYNKRHFDYRGLIEMGLALEAPEGMYKNEITMKKPDFEKEAVAFCFDNGINVTPYQAARIAEFFYDYGYGMGYADGTHDEKNHGRKI